MLKFSNVYYLLKCKPATGRAQNLFAPPTKANCLFMLVINVELTRFRSGASLWCICRPNRRPGLKRRKCHLEPARLTTFCAVSSSAESVGGRLPCNQGPAVELSPALGTVIKGGIFKATAIDVVSPSNHRSAFLMVATGPWDDFVISYE